ncbi:MAG: DUF6427 family protein [Flavobacteriaceae bacterium]|nr:DUF6427 family protein [Flavobacteriaceae bacterium]
MIARFFSTSKPIHFVIVILLTFVVFMITRISSFEEDLSLLLILKQIVLYAVVLISIFVLDFLVNKNNLTKRNSYKILLFSLFIAILPITIQVDNILISNLFILLALRRIISLRTNKRVKKKLFDAAFWIGIASLFYFWSILFFILIFAALFFYSINNFKNWIIPFISLLTVIVIIISYSIIESNSFSDLNNYLDAISFDFTKYNVLGLIIGITILMSLGLWALLFYIINLKGKIKRQRPSHILIIVAVLISVVIVLIAPNKSGSEFIFMFAPLAVIMANYIESIKEKWFAEIFLWILILTPISYLAL